MLGLMQGLSRELCIGMARTTAVDTEMKSEHILITGGVWVCPVITWVAFMVF